MGLTIVSTMYAFCSPHCLPSPPPQHLNPLFLNQSPAKAGHGQLYPPTLSPHSFAMLQQSPGNISIRELVCRESERVAGGEGWRSGIEWGKREMEGRWRRRGVLWEGSQSNYRQRCSPGFFGGTKFTFQRSLPPSPPVPSCFSFYLCFFSATLFFFSSRLRHPTNRASPHHTTPHHTPPSFFRHLPVSLGLHERGKPIENASPAKHLVTL